METVEVVIKIPKQVYEHINVWKDIVYDDYIAMVTNAILNGTVLPKGHGRLIDADRIITEATERMKYPANHQYMECVIAHMKLAPTIIEADNEVENDG